MEVQLCPGQQVKNVGSEERIPPGPPLEGHLCSAKVLSLMSRLSFFHVRIVKRTHEVINTTLAGNNRILCLDTVFGSFEDRRVTRGKRSCLLVGATKSTVQHLRA